MFCLTVESLIFNLILMVELFLFFLIILYIFSLGGMEKYENLGIIGEGSYGVVIKCRHKETGQVNIYIYIIDIQSRDIQRVYR